MMGGRGAKGSVNDRIISYLYRKRYLEYLKKKENYTKEEREKAREYLKKIKEFDIEDNVSVLEDEDRKLLDDVYGNITANDFFDEPEKSFALNPELESVNGYQDVKDIGNISDNVSKLDSDSLLEDALAKGKKIQEFDPFNENYDFDKYDYYEIVGKKGAVGDVKKDEIIDVDKEEKKLSDEQIIIEEVTEFINDSKRDLTEIKYELDDIKKSVDELHTEQDVQELEERFNEVKEKLNKLRDKYYVMKEKYDFEDYDILDNLKLVDAIDDFKDKASLEELELMVDACKYEIEAIDGVVIEEEKRVGIDEEVEQKHKLIKERDNVFRERKNQLFDLSDNEATIERELVIQQRIIANLEERLAQITSETRQVEYYTYNTGLMFRSFLRITAGILTTPFTGHRVFNTMLGTDLINRGLRNLRTSLIPEPRIRTEIRERYESVEYEILKSKSDVDVTKALLDDSIKQIDELKDYFNVHIKGEADYIPEYQQVKEMMEKLDKQLKDKKEEITKIDKHLDEQYENNKQKVLRAQRGFHTEDR